MNDVYLALPASVSLPLPIGHWAGPHLDSCQMLFNSPTTCFQIETCSTLDVKWTLLITRADLGQAEEVSLSIAGA